MKISAFKEFFKKVFTKLLLRLRKFFTNGRVGWLFLLCTVLILIATIGVAVEFPVFQFKMAGHNVSKMDKYAVMTSVILPDGTLNYLEINTPDGNYTELPHQSDKDGYTYTLRDWLTNDNRLFVINPSYNESASTEIGKAVWLETPKIYSKLVTGRKSMYVDILSKSMLARKVDTVSMDIGTGDTVKVNRYRGKLSAKSIRELFMVDNYMLQRSLANQADLERNTDLLSYLNTTLAHLDKSLTFSSAEVTFGIYDNKLVFWEFETGGLGNTLTISKKLVLSQLDARELPDFSNAKDYYDFVDFQYKSNKDAKSDSTKSDINSSDSKANAK